MIDLRGSSCHAHINKIVARQIQISGQEADSPGGQLWHSCRRPRGSCALCQFYSQCHSLMVSSRLHYHVLHKKRRLSTPSTSSFLYHRLFFRPSTGAYCWRSFLLLRHYLDSFRQPISIAAYLSRLSMIILICWLHVACFD